MKLLLTGDAPIISYERASARALALRTASERSGKLGHMKRWLDLYEAGQRASMVAIRAGAAKFGFVTADAR